MLATLESDLLAGIFHVSAKYCSEDHLNILYEGIMIEVIEVDADFGGGTSLCRFITGGPGATH